MKIMRPLIPAAWCLLILALRGLSQCLPANPSFEVTAGTPLLPGWQLGGDVRRDSLASHGHVSARLQGGGGSVLIWQEVEACPGQVWQATGKARPVHALDSGSASRAWATLEWRDATGALLDVASSQVADADTPPGVWSSWVVVAGPAPAGSQRLRLLLELEQVAEEAPWGLLWDEVDLLCEADRASAQWSDFPGGRQLDFAGLAWRVKGPGWYGPGSNFFSDDGAAVQVDDAGRLHLSILPLAGLWACSEVALVDALGYGDYRFTTRGALDQLDPRAVLGLFLWQYAPCWNAGDAWWNPYNEIDVEFSRWGNPANPLGQFVAQPWDGAGNLVRFDASFGVDELATHAFRWLPDRVEFRSWRGGPGEESNGQLLHAWTYAGPHLPRLEEPRVHLNLWLAGGAPSQAQEVVLETFTFQALEEEDKLPFPPSRHNRPRALELSAAPNPFNHRVRFTYTLVEGGPAVLEIFRLDGSRVRRLSAGLQGPGLQSEVWDGLDEGGRDLPSGLYLARLEAAGFQSVRRVLLVK